MDGQGGGIDRLPWSGSGEAGSLLVLPGGSGGVFQPPLYWSTVALVDEGWEVFVARWSPMVDDAEVVALASEGMGRVSRSPRSLVMGKSLGSVAAAETDAAKIPAVWFTPLTDRDLIRDVFSAPSAPTLLVGGSADPTWRQPSDAAGLRIREIPGATHGLIVPGDWRSSMTYLQMIVDDVLDFVHSL